MARKPSKKTQRAEPGETDLIEKIEDVDITDVMHDRYRDYAIDVVVDRALPDVRDGLKPVHRRIIYTMSQLGLSSTSVFRKCAKISGQVMGDYHPHGDASIYDSLVRLAQPWAMTEPLIDGQGNFGSPDGDNAAASRYTEARLGAISRFLIQDIDSDTVDFRPNYDGTITEPVVLPAAFPNILVNGGSGIAVGMANSIAPHNLTEVIDATLLRLRNSNTSLEELMTVLPGPDFPTAGRIIGNSGIVKAYETGRGSLTMEATTSIEKDGRSPLLVYTDMPWDVMRPKVLGQINDLIKAGSLPDVVSARDETDRHGPRFVVELRPGSDPDRNDALLKTHTSLRANVSLNLTMLDSHGIPREMGLAQILDEWIGFRRTTIRRRSNFQLKKARDRGRLLLGRIAALTVIDKIVKLIRAAKDREEAIEALCAMSFTSADFGELVSLLGTEEQKRGKRFQLIRLQAEDILAMRLQRLTGMEREGMEEEAHRIVAQMHELRAILTDLGKLDDVIALELNEIRALNPSTRRSVIDSDAAVETAKITAPAIPLEATFLIETADGLLARSKKGLPDDLAGRSTETNTHSRLVIFTDRGQSYGLDIFSLPSLEAKEAPRALPGLLGLTPLGRPISFITLTLDDLKPAADGGSILTFVSRDGSVRRTEASEFARIPQPGKMAMKLDDADPSLLTVFRETPGQDQSGRALGRALFMGTEQGKIIRFSLEDIRVFTGRTARGVRGMKLDTGDRIVSAFEVPDITLSAEDADRLEATWLGKAPKKDLPDTLADLLDGPELVQLAGSGHMKRTLLAAYRQTRRDNRGINDRGPAKTIGPMLGWALARAGETGLPLRFAEDVRSVEISDLRKSGKATTGGLAAEGASGFL